MVLTENWTTNPRPSISDLVELAVQAETVDAGGVMVSDHVVRVASSNEHGEPRNLRHYAVPRAEEHD